MKLGIITPVLTMLPTGHAGWERDGTIEDVARVAEAADALGYDHLTCSEHVAVPEDVVPVRGGRYWDPLATFGYLAARTARIRFATDVLVLGYHHPLDIAKRYGTLDQVSGGRLVLGVGVGSLQEEFELLGAPFEDRGPRADDALRALRASLSVAVPSYDGEFHRFGGMVVDPHALQAHVPIWVGGRTRRSLRRAVELADGWCPFGLGATEAGAMLRDLLPADRPFEVVLQNQRPFDPSGDPERTAEGAAALQAAGATMLSLRLVHHSREHYVEQLEAMRDLVVSLGASGPTPTA